jgi:sensor histidine kinase YesM
LEIEKVRFDERLTVEWDVKAEADDALVPSLILQPLIENAVKYAISKMEKGGTIWISATLLDDDLVLEVTDNGPGADLAIGELKRTGGVGLQNIKDRLTALYRNNFAFDVSQNQPSGIKVCIRIPYQTQDHFS